jgi:hypothetical protein
VATISKFDLCSAAFLSFGAGRITSFDDGTAESTIAAGLYDMIVAEEISRHRWNFAKSYATLNRLVGSPAHKWAYEWQLPEDCLLLRAVYVAGQPVAYEQYKGRTVGTNDDTAPVAEYTGRLTEDQWPEYFQALIRKRLEAHFAGALLKDPGIRDKMLAEQDTSPRGFYGKARALDGQEEPPHTLPKGLLSRARGR